MFIREPYTVAITQPEVPSPTCLP